MGKDIIEMIDVIDENDEVIKTITVDEVYKSKLPHRIVHVLIFDKNGKLACQVRTKNKNFCPGCYATSVGGHVSSGETPDVAAKREMKEEIGKVAEVEFLFSHWYEINGLKKLLYVFESKPSPPFKLNKNEVERIEYLDYDEISSLPKQRIHPELRFIIDKLSA